MTGTGNHWPFLYQGREKEPDDPGPYYYSGSGQFYSPQLVRSLSETSQTSSSGTGGPPQSQSRLRGSSSAIRRVGIGLWKFIGVPETGWRNFSSLEWRASRRAGSVVAPYL